ncbi:MAG: hypothetical protein B9J98_08170 [Candidatus Terraquivivens tikiterensis]|uniref:Uncharacterized protein n=1 Tax=Candidatus Terraquivivens tikiterensis TaxID=1980982 RepID=A0A2R7Y0I4_9ARCH|nr:MAG: hypothetical protein B9J98_08170 [Candidatus Terraquivivens tikiterensis]
MPPAPHKETHLTGGVDEVLNLTNINNAIGFRVDYHYARHSYGGADPVYNLDRLNVRGAEIVTPDYYLRNISKVDCHLKPLYDNSKYLGDISLRWYVGYIYDLEFWAGGANGAATFYFPFSSSTDATLRPYTDGYSYIGTSSYRFRLVRAVTITQGDLGFEEDRCMVCGKQFKPNDSIVLKVYKIDKENKQVLTVPVHSECNPHEISAEMLEHHQREVLAPKKNPKEELRYKMPNPEIGFEIVWEAPIDEEYMYVQAKFDDGISVCPIVRIDASEEEVVNAIKEAYLVEKRRLIEEHEKRKKGEEKLKSLGKSLKGKKMKLRL